MEKHNYTEWNRRVDCTAAEQPSGEDGLNIFESREAYNELYCEKWYVLQKQGKIPFFRVDLDMTGLLRSKAKFKAKLTRV